MRQDKMELQLSTTVHTLTNKQCYLGLSMWKMLTEILQSEIDQTVQGGSKYKKTDAIAEIILLCARQDLALRGHHELKESSNRGNFIEILHIVAEHDKIVKDKLQNGPRNAIYTSPNIQNSLLNILGDMARSIICKGVHEVGFFSHLADETKDCSKREQM